MADISADIRAAWEHEALRANLGHCEWNGIGTPSSVNCFGERYGSAAETRIARDFMEVPIWLQGGPEPSTLSETLFRADRLKTMRMLRSAAYKGRNALLRNEGAQDFRSGQKFDHTIFFGENVDIHHIFPQDCCKKQGIGPKVYDSIINKTPLSYKTNRIVGGVAPSEYLAKLEKGGATSPPIDPERLNLYLSSHRIDPSLLRADNFEAFMADRQSKLLHLIERATGKSVYAGAFQEEGEDVDGDPNDSVAESPAAPLQHRSLKLGRSFEQTLAVTMVGSTCARTSHPHSSAEFLRIMGTHGLEPWLGSLTVRTKSR